MSLACGHCGYKSNEIKGGGAIPRLGTRITLNVTCTDDLAREVLKSDTAGVSIPELDFVLQEGGLDGVYTTIEGLISKMYQRLLDANPFGSGDSSTKHHLHTEEGNHYKNYQSFLLKLHQMANGQILPFTVIITDPMSNSFIGPIPKHAMALASQAQQDGNMNCYQSYIDPTMTVEQFERTYEMNDALGLNDIQTEHYQQYARNEDITYYATDQLQELPDRITTPHIRAPDHPLQVAKGTNHGDTTLMGPASTQFAIPSIALRTTHPTNKSTAKQD